MNALTVDYQLSRDTHGRLVFTAADGQRVEGVVPVRAFPITAPDDGIALVDPHGHELAWIPRLEQLPRALAEIVAEELAGREFMPVISRIISVSTIYRAVRAGLLNPTGTSAKFVLRRLLHHGKRRHKKGAEERRGKFIISHPIEERPASAEKRTVRGH